MNVPQTKSELLLAIDKNFNKLISYLNVILPESGFKWNQLGLLAQKFYSDYRELNYKALITELESVKDHIVKLIDERTDDELYGKPWYTKWTMGRMISFNTSSPYANANGRIRKWAKNNNISLK